MSNFPDALLQLTLGSSQIFWSRSDAEVVNIEVILNTKSETFLMLFIFILNSVTDKILSWGTPSSCLWRLGKVDPTRTWNFLSERKLFMKMQVFHYFEPPSGVKSLLQIKEDSYKMLFLDVDLSYGGFQFDHMIDYWFPLSESRLRIGDMFVGLEKPDQSFVGHTLHSSCSENNMCTFYLLGHVCQVQVSSFFV